jgi:hypothetical protein
MLPVPSLDFGIAPYYLPPELKLSVCCDRASGPCPNSTASLQLFGHFRMDGIRYYVPRHGTFFDSVISAGEVDRSYNL